MGSDGADIVFHCMYFRDVKVLSDVRVNKNMFVGMEAGKGIVQVCKGRTGMWGVLSKVYEVQNSSGSIECIWWYCAWDEANKDLLHILELRPRPLGNGWNAFFEVSDARVTRHWFEVMISFQLVSKMCAPGGHMILKHTFMQLMQYIWSDACKDIAMW